MDNTALHVIVLVGMVIGIYYMPTHWLTGYREEVSIEDIYDIVYVDLSSPNGVVQHFSIHAKSRAEALKQAKVNKYLGKQCHIISVTRHANDL